MEINGEALPAMVGSGNGTCHFSEEAARTLREVGAELFVRQSVSLNCALRSEKAKIECSCFYMVHLTFRQNIRSLFLRL